jgi:2-methylcitrate dehydratase PrpD
MDAEVAAATEHASPARALAEFAGALRYEDIPAPVVELAKLLILDALGCALAATRYEFAKATLAGARALGGDGPCAVIGNAARLPLRDAALVNGVLLHGLDFDDSNFLGILHPTVACLPAALGVGQSLGASGREVLTAYVAGMETAIRIGAAARGIFHHIGFHATGLVAHFSSAIVAGKLMGLDAAQLVSAQGITASTSSAVQVFLEEGAWTKRLHPAWGAVAGITAATLAQHGFFGPSRAYEGRFGFFETHLQTHLPEVDYTRMTEGLGTEWSLLQTAVKPYPACHFAHGCAEAAILLHQRFKLTQDDIAHVVAAIPRDTLPIIAEPAERKQKPANDYDAKFSAQFITAACLLRGRFGLAELEADALADPGILALAAKVDCVADTDSAFPEFNSGGVTVTTKDGATHREHIRVNLGMGDRAMSAADITAKFRASASLAFNAAQVDQLERVVLHLENANADALARVASTGGNA